MRKPVTFLTALAVSGLLALPMARAEDAPGADTVVATVNGTQITLGHMIVAFSTLPEQYQQLPADVLFPGILNQLIQQEALAQALTREPGRAVQLSLENERRSLTAAEHIEDVMAGAATEEAIQAAYDALYADGTAGDEYNAAHILIETEEEAKAIIAELEGGADFTELAKARSTGPSGPNGGELGWFRAGQMVPDFEAAVIALEPGAISGPVQTQFGWHVIRLNEVRKAEAPALETVRDELALTIQREAVQARIDELTAAATVERPGLDGIDPTVISNFDLLRN
ncbi:MAG: peptidylprolyl isomerase [Rhodobacteraceae bacterium]|nr:MAG: peptidylprolyl isomerase [Paracoccaceae bacterium]